MKFNEVNKSTCDEVREYLQELIQKLDELDEVDYFGSEGWRGMLLGEI